MQFIRTALGETIRGRRKNLGLSQQAMAERLALHRNYVSLVERGVQNITLETLCKLSDVLGCFPSALLGEVEASVKRTAPETLEPFTASRRRRSGKAPGSKA